MSPLERCARTQITFVALLPKVTSPIYSWENISHTQMEEKFCKHHKPVPFWGVKGMKVKGRKAEELFSTEGTGMRQHLKGHSASGSWGGGAGPERYPGDMTTNTACHPGLDPGHWWENQWNLKKVSRLHDRSAPRLISRLWPLPCGYVRLTCEGSVYTGTVHRPCTTFLSL